MRRITYIPAIGSRRTGRSFAWYPRAFYENGQVTWIWLEWYEWVDTYFGQGEWYRNLQEWNDGEGAIK